MEKVTKLDQFIEINGNGDIRKALAITILELERLREQATQQGVHLTIGESGGFCEKHGVVFYGESCPLCIEGTPMGMDFWGEDSDGVWRHHPSPRR